MMNLGLLTALAFCVLAVATVFRFWPCLRDLRNVLNEREMRFGEYAPPARVILCLRGVDPFLDRCLQGLATQDYPEYKVIIVVDSIHDDALPQAQVLQNTYGDHRVEVVIRDRLLPHCSRRISSFLCGMDRVPSETEVLVMCDADAIPHRTWLRELIAPLSDPETLAASGNRWYAPLRLNIGSACRANWYAMAIPAMRRYQLLWGGSLSMRREVFRDPDFISRLERTFSEDMAIAQFVASQRKRSRILTSLILLNEETCTLKSFWGFLVRQMLTTRLEHSCWPSLVGEALVLFLLQWVLFPIAVVFSSGVGLWLTVGSWVACGSVMLGVQVYYEWLLRRVLWEKRQQRFALSVWNRVIFAVPILVLTGLVYPLAVFQTLFARTHEWRGIVYRISDSGISTIHAKERFGSATPEGCESI